MLFINRLTACSEFGVRREGGILMWLRPQRIGGANNTSIQLLQIRYITDVCYITDICYVTLCYTFGACALIVELWAHTCVAVHLDLLTHPLCCSFGHEVHCGWHHVDRIRHKRICRVNLTTECLMSSLLSHRSLTHHPCRPSGQLEHRVSKEVSHTKCDPILVAPQAWF